MNRLERESARNGAKDKVEELQQMTAMRVEARQAEADMRMWRKQEAFAEEAALKQEVREEKYRNIEK